MALRDDIFFCVVSGAVRVLFMVRGVVAGAFDVARSRTLPPDCMFVARETVVFFVDDWVVVSDFWRFEDTVFVVPRRVAARTMSDASSATAA